MKRIFSLIVSLLMAIACFSLVACGTVPMYSSSANSTSTSAANSTSTSASNSNSEPAQILSVSAPDGAPIMALSYMMKTDNDYNYSVVSGSDIPVIFTKAEQDFVIAPTNAGMKLSIAQKKYKIIATTSWGNLYLVGTGEAKPLAECSSIDEFMAQFNGQEVTSIGADQVPDKSFKHLLTQKGINCTVNAYTDAPLIIAGLKNGDVSYGILGEPAVTGAMGQVTELKRLCSISEIWEAIVGTEYPQASVFAKATLTNEQIDTFLTKLEASVNYLNASEANALELGTYMENRGDSTLKGAVVKKSYLKMNQRFVLAGECKQEIINFISVLGVNYNEQADSGVFYEKGTN